MERVKDVVNANDVFSEFDYEPFKSASIGQVHMAKLLDGREVVVKIKRPNIYDIMKRDTDNIVDVVNFLERVGHRYGCDVWEGPRRVHRVPFV
jgi:predicted unusual protein kinase regulating ubiquinone biosynthesis (AarF/ABC1/UbiB family)